MATIVWKEIVAKSPLFVEWNLLLIMVSYKNNETNFYDRSFLINNFIIIIIIIIIIGTILIFLLIKITVFTTILQKCKIGVR